MIEIKTHADHISGIVRHNGRSVGGFWQNGDGNWSVRVDGFTVAVVRTKKDVRKFAESCFE